MRAAGPVGILRAWHLHIETEPQATHRMQRSGTCCATSRRVIAPSKATSRGRRSSGKSENSSSENVLTHRQQMSKCGSRGGWNAASNGTKIILLTDRRSVRVSLMMKRVAFYLRVSTDQQSVENQRRELQGVAERMGWHVVEVLADEGISGAKGRDKRPAFDRLMTMVTRRDIDLIACWSVDRLGRSLQHLIGFLGEINAQGVDLYLHQQALDTSTPTGRAMFGLLSVFAEFERAILRERIMAGLARSKAEGKRSGRPPLDFDKKRKIERLLIGGTSINATAKKLRVGIGTVHRIKTKMAMPAQTAREAA